jgi:hypothetical protein
MYYSWIRGQYFTTDCQLYWWGAHNRFCLAAAWCHSYHSGYLSEQFKRLRAKEKWKHLHVHCCIFAKECCFLQFPRLCPFVLLVAVVVQRRWTWSIRRMTLAWCSWISREQYVTVSLLDLKSHLDWPDLLSKLDQTAECRNLRLTVQEHVVGAVSLKTLWKVWQRRKSNIFTHKCTIFPVVF